MKLSKGISLLGIVAFIFLIGGCDKTKLYDITAPPEVAHFTNLTAGTYTISAVGVTYKVPVGFTTVSTKDRTVSVIVTSKTGAILGTHYTLNKTTALIPAGKTTDSITVSGVYSQYIAGRKDTLVFTLQDGTDVKVADYNRTFTLAVRGPCFEGDVTLTALLGTYAHTNEDYGGPYGPYTTKITSVIQLTPTTGTIVVANIWDNGWNPITFTLDWTDPVNRKVTLVQQSGIANGSTYSATYAGQDISVRPFAGQTGTFSACNSTITIKMQIGITGLGFFGTLYTVNMAR